jgi:4-hydroxy-tetrahydrodipicolinate reductase
MNKPLKNEPNEGRRPMRIGIVGYGRMGKEVERLAGEQGVRVAWVLNEDENQGGVGLTEDLLVEVDVCIEFTAPAAALANVQCVLAQGGKIVCGTTGWYSQLHKAESSVTPGSALVYGTNFSVGANLFAMITEQAAGLFGAFEEYDVAIHELHHAGKVDHPSGTALMLGEVVCEAFPQKTRVVSEVGPGRIHGEDLHVSFTRVGKMPGRHIVYFDGDHDTVEIHHTARGRCGFARGALMAASWITDREGVFTFQHVLRSLIDRRKP